MSITYTPATNFGAKDSLPTNDSNKVIRGSEFTTEFTAIQTAFSNAAPAASPTFTGTVTIASVDINGGNIDGTTIGGTTPAAGTFSSLTATTADINGGTIDGVTIGGSSAGAGTFTNLTATGTTTLAGASTTADITFGDDDKAIFGAGSDLQIYHDGTRSYIQDSGTGDLRLRTNELRMVNADNTEVGIKAVEDGAVDLYYNGNSKLATTATGIDVTGTVTADDELRLDGGAPKIKFFESDTTDVNTSLTQGGGNLFVQTYTDGDAFSANRLKIDNTTGDISFYEDTGTTPKFFWDASAESLGIGTSSPSSELEISATTSPTLTFERSGAADGNGIIQSVGNTGTVNAKITLGSGLSDIIQFDVDGSERMRITRDGNVGIGTSSPATALHIASTAAPELRVEDTTNNTIASLRPLDTTVRFGVFSNHPLEFYTNSTERMRITSSGNLLVGTASVPSGGVQKFSVKQTGGDLSSTTVTRANMTGIITADADSPTNNYGNGIWFNSGSLMAGIASTRVTTGNWGTDLRFYTHPTTTSNVDETYERMRINSSGDVGIGTSSPAYKLDVSGSIGVTGLFVNKGSTGTIAQFGGADTDVLNIDGGSDVVTLDARNVSALTFERQGSEAMRINSSGKLLINTTSETTPGNNSAYLIVESDSGAAQEGIYIRSDGGAGDPAFVVGDASNVAQLNIYGDGDVENTNGTYGTISDARVKENITDAGSQWDDFKALRIRKYNLISKPDEPHIGVIAQELEEAGMAGLVKETRQDGMKSVKTSILYMKAIKALQEAMERIEALEAEVAALKGA